MTQTVAIEVLRRHGSSPILGGVAKNITRTVQGVVVARDNGDLAILPTTATYNFDDPLVVALRFQAEASVTWYAYWEYLVAASLGISCGSDGADMRWREVDGSPTHVHLEIGSRPKGFVSIGFPVESLKDLVREFDDLYQRGAAEAGERLAGEIEGYLSSAPGAA